MIFIQLTEITKALNGTVESEIARKVTIPVNLIAEITESKELAPPKGFYTENQIDYNIPTSTILINCYSLTKTICVAEKYQDIIKKLQKHNTVV